MIRKVKMHDKKIFQMLMAGSNVWSIGEDGKVIIWNVETCEKINELIIQECGGMTLFPSDAKKSTYDKMGIPQCVWITCSSGKIFLYNAKVAFPSLFLPFPSFSYS